MQNNAPTPEQLKPLLERHYATWNWFMKMVFFGTIGTAVILVLMWAFLVPHKMG